MGDSIFQICNLSFDVSDMSRKPIIGDAPKLQILKDITIDLLFYSIWRCGWYSGRFWFWKVDPWTRNAPSARTKQRKSLF